MRLGDAAGCCRSIEAPIAGSDRGGANLRRLLRMTPMCDVAWLGCRCLLAKSMSLATLRVDHATPWEQDKTRPPTPIAIAQLLNMTPRALRGTFRFSAAKLPDNSSSLPQNRRNDEHRANFPQDYLGPALRRITELISVKPTFCRTMLVQWYGVVKALATG